MPALDIETSAAFYQEVFGWKTRKRGDGATAFDDAAGQVSGTWKKNRKPATEPLLLVYIMVDDMEATISMIQKKGGRIVQPVGNDLPEITARFSDPAGNVFGLYQQPR
jgi:predicted enzyme related to lactoylglutathione lyase